jgi:hypothetical protein
MSANYTCNQVSDLLSNLRKTLEVKSALSIVVLINNIIS